MQRRATMTRSCSSVIAVKMNASIAFMMCCVLGSAVGYYVKREAPYNIGPNDPYPASVNQNYAQEPSQRLFWSSQGTNQVGGTGLWATLTNKFPFLGNMFGRMELPTQYGIPNQNDISTQYGAPANVQPQFYQNPAYYQQQQQQYLQQFSQQYPQQYQQQFQPQYPRYQQQLPQFNQRFVPSARDVAFTDDAVIVTPPQVPIAQPAPAPLPVPAPAPIPSLEPAGYSYDKPQYRLELPHK